ncbi:MAG: SoxR reducing system RseC family protein [Tannerella sp.]|jgi:sigma-E factor negative regulatory protein RseC|nr:SoxR reducing system RseC family protein [Tannerella sp.]
MERMADSVNYCGTVTRVGEGKAYVSVAPKAACTGCQLQSACMTAGGKEQIIEAPVPAGLSLTAGEAVTLSCRASSEWKAAFWAFALPLLLVIAVAALFSALHWGDEKSALIALAVLPPYYLVLYLCRNILKKKFIFTITKGGEEETQRSYES